MNIAGWIAGSAAAAALAAGAAAQDRIVVVNKGGDSLAIVDAGTYETLHLIPTGATPHEVHVAPDGRTAYVSDYGARARGETVTVIDLEIAEATAAWPLEGNLGPHGIWTSSDGAHVWVTTETSRTVVELDAGTGELARVWETGQDVSHMVAPSPDETRLYVANIGSGSITVIDRGDDSVTTVPTGAGAEGIDVSADGAEIWVTNRDDDTISIVDAATLEVIETLDAGGAMPIRAKFSADGAEVWVSNARSGTVTVFDAASRELIATIEVGAVPVGLLMSPDGGRVFVANTMDDQVSVIDRASREVVAAFAPGSEPDGMDWVPAR
jgi:YVTN family beta-propeller protein